MCDLCPRFAHPKCIGLSEKMTNEYEEWFCRRCDEKIAYSVVPRPDKTHQPANGQIENAGVVITVENAQSEPKSEEEVQAEKDAQAEEDSQMDESNAVEGSDIEEKSQLDEEVEDDEGEPEQSSVDETQLAEDAEPQSENDASDAENDDGMQVDP